MSGVSWRHRKEGDWLASNGRWYPKNQYPRGWDRSALPPAPGHSTERSVADLVSSATSRMQDFAGIGTEPNGAGLDASADSSPFVDDDPADRTTAPKVWSRPPAPARPTYTRPPPPARPSSRSAANATVTSQSTYTRKINPGVPQARGLPPAPGRISPDAVDLELDFGDLPGIDGTGDDGLADPPAPTSPPPPTAAPESASAEPIRPQMPSVGATDDAPSTVAGDLGRAFGSARRRIEKVTEDLE